MFFSIIHTHRHTHTYTNTRQIFQTRIFDWKLYLWLLEFSLFFRNVYLWMLFRERIHELIAITINISNSKGKTFYGKIKDRLEWFSLHTRIPNKKRT